MPEKTYSVNMLIALFTDFKEDGFRTLSESEVQEALQSVSVPTPRAPDACPYCAGKGVNHFGGLILKDCIHCSGTGQRR